ncbi:MAG: hypothetical protein HRU12_21635, partial [Phaeodactylibacter sp.]|nr:hypothetical protein [Phaeodactylibacter sp.]
MGLALGLGLGSGLVSSTPPAPIQEITEDEIIYEEVDSSQKNMHSEVGDGVRVIEESVKRAETFEGFEGEVYTLNGLCHIGYGHLTECDDPAILSMTEANELLMDDMLIV